MVNKKLSALFCVLIFFISCKQDETPKGIIEKDKMTGILVDMHITDSYLNQVVNADTTQREAKSRYNYIFKKHHIDSAKFSRSLNYYSLKTDELDKIYQKVLDSLERMETALKPKVKAKIKTKRKVTSKKLNDLSTK